MYLLLYLFKIMSVNSGIIFLKQTGNLYQKHWNVFIICNHVVYIILVNDNTTSLYSLAKASGNFFVKKLCSPRENSGEVHII